MHCTHTKPCGAQKRCAIGRPTQLWLVGGNTRHGAAHLGVGEQQAMHAVPSRPAHLFVNTQQVSPAFQTLRTLAQAKIAAAEGRDCSQLHSCQSTRVCVCVCTPTTHRPPSPSAASPALHMPPVLLLQLPLPPAAKTMCPSDLPHMSKLCATAANKHTRAVRSTAQLSCRTEAPIE